MAMGVRQKKARAVVDAKVRRLSHVAARTPPCDGLYFSGTWLPSSLPAATSACPTRYLRQSSCALSAPPHVLRVQRARVDIRDGLCFVTGLLWGSCREGSLIAVLPFNCRPQGGDLSFSVLKGGLPARVDVRCPRCDCH